MTIEFFFAGTKAVLTERIRLKKYLASLFLKKKKSVQALRIVFCTDSFLLEINRQFLRHDYYTDIITFNLSSPGQPVEGEIYISVDRVRENARSLGVSIKSELHRVVFHGALHLCGYKDKSQKEKKIMRLEEDKCLAAYFNRST